MNFKRIIIGSVICMIWLIHEILSNPINEKNSPSPKNMTEFIMMPFTINANPMSYNETISTTVKPTVKATIEKTTKPTQAVIPTIVTFPKNHKPSFQPHTEPGSIEFIKNGRNQKWQIPSPIQFTTPDPRDTNSTKRQLVMEKFSEMEFVPSREIGSFDNTEGFVPKIHQPKTISFIKPLRQDPIIESKQNSQVTISSNFDKNILVPPRRIPNAQSEFSNFKTFPTKNNKRKKNSGENRRNPQRRQGVMEEFQKDFGKLVTKYPELGDLINGYPVMEEIMKQKLAEMFQKSSQYHKNYSDEQFYDDSSESDEDEEEEENKDGKLKFNTNQGLPLKFTNYKFQSDADSNVNIYGDNPQTFEGAPYPFDGKKPSWSYKKKPDEIQSNIPAGGYYQSLKFPNIDDQKSEQKPIEEENPLNLEFHERPPMSPWKRAVHMLTAFLPVGLLISALTPSIVNINNTADQAYPIRQRSADWNNPASKLSTSLQEKLLGKFHDLESLRLMKNTLSDNPVCDDWNFCELAKKGSEPDAVGVEKIFWQLAHEVPEHIAERNGMKKLFKAIKLKDCSQFACKDNHKLLTGEEIDGNKKSKDEFHFKNEDLGEMSSSFGAMEESTDKISVKKNKAVIDEDVVAKRYNDTVQTISVF